MPHRVFLSSTFSDLEQHRQVVQKAIRQLGALDVSMENFGARDERPAEECIRLVREESDVFVGIYAHKYGFVPDEEEHSICELEYKAASDADLPRFAYVVDRSHPWPPDYVDEGDARSKLASFKDHLFKRHICQTFKEPDQLATLVAADLGRHFAMQAAPKIGPDIPVKDIGMESVRGNPFEEPHEWNVKRNSLYQNNRNLFIAHVIKPSSKEGQKFDVFVYLVRHDADKFEKGFPDVLVAEFFLGPYWDNKVFPAVEENGFIGISTSAYGTFLCLCRVTFKEGPEVLLHRYIDFEAQRTGGQGA